MPNTELDHRALYRLPWSLSDNPIAWLEPTQACNLACDGCYRKNVTEHDPVEDVQADLDTFVRLRNFDGISIAGGDPLMHPQLPDIVSRVRALGRKPIVNTNGLALTRELLHELKKAGLVGVTFHVDSRQGRPGWRDKTEQEMNDLRSHYAELVASEGNIACAFNATVYEETLSQVPDVLDWGRRNIDKVHTIVFIAYRAALDGDFDYYAGGEPIDMQEIVYSSDAPRRIDIDAREIVKTIRGRFPDFMPAAYLNGTEDPEAFKWLLSLRVGNSQRIHGYLGPRTVEASQVGYHLISGRYLGYATPLSLGMGRSILAAAWPFDGGARRALASVARHPGDALRRLHLQSVMIIQPIDVLADGRQSMCDGCPDMTVHDGKLVWSCRLEELRQFGRFVTTVPKKQEVRVASVAGK